MELDLFSRFTGLTTVNKNLKNDIVSFNERSSEYGLTLTEKDAEMLVTAGQESIKQLDRIEFGKSITLKIMEAFVESPFINQSDYAKTLAELIDVFYETKDECYDLLTDDEVIGKMFEYFNRTCGNVEVMQSKYLSEMCRKLRLGYDDDEDNDAEEDEDDE